MLLIQLLFLKVPFLPMTPYLSIMSCLVLMVATGDMMSWSGVGIATVLGKWQSENYPIIVKLTQGYY